MKTLFTSFIILISFSMSAQMSDCCINPDWIDPTAMCSSDWDPVVGCDGATYSNACGAQTSGVTAWTNAAGQAITLEWDCVTSMPLCISWSGIEIYETGFWTNPNDPCEMGECGPNGEFYGIAIDCAQWMDVPCDGEWVLEDGECCAACIEMPISDCENITITLTSGWNMIGFACDENTDAIVSFASIQDKIIIAKDGVGNAYLPDWEFNGIGDLQRGYGYLIKVSEEITEYNICE
jgi:hypothetical protein